jgi:hypothetical protein
MTASCLKCVKAARALLLRQETAAFATNVQGLRFDKAIYFDTFQNYSKLTGAALDNLTLLSRFCDGYSAVRDDIFLILTDARAFSVPKAHRSIKGENPENRRLKWTLAHEVGHIVLEHKRDGAAEEQEANRFAAELLMPEPVMAVLKAGLDGTLTAPEVSRLFGVSANAARSRLAELGGGRCFSPCLRREITEKYRSLTDDYLRRANRFYSRECVLIP